MKIKDIAKMPLLTIRRAFGNRLRSVLTAAGIAVGAASVMIVSSIGNIGKAAINSELSGMGIDSLVISASGLDESTLDDIRLSDNVSCAAPLMNRSVTVKLRGTESGAMVWGVNENAGSVISLDVICGRLINRGDIAGHKKVCVIDEAAAYGSYKRANITGKTLTMKIGGEDVSFEVIGVVKNGVNPLQNMLGGFIPDFVYIPYTVMQDCTGSRNFDTITARLFESEKSGKTASEIENMLSSAGKGSVRVEDLLAQKEQMNDILEIASFALSAVAGISLAVSGISIMTSMLVSVSERTREIGIKKAIGASDSDIMLEFLAESAVITLAGGIAGVASGAAIAGIIRAAAGVKTAADLKPALIILAVCLFTGIISGVYPAKKAAELDPAEALRK